MRVSTLYLSAAALLAPLAVWASPLPRAIDAASLQVLNFAYVLENLETQFYSQALGKFQPSDFLSAGFVSSDVAITEITVIQIDESVHVSAIQELIISFGQTPLSTCTYDFSSALTDVETMLTIAQVVENVGVGAYLGAAHLVADPRVLTAAASIVTIESRHQTLLNLFQGFSPVPQSFDMPLLPNEVLAIAGPFIKGCDLGIQANPSLTVTNTGSITVGTLLEFSSSAFSGTPSGFHCQMLIGGMPFSLSLPISQCVVPQGINGPVAIWITSDDQPLNGGVVDRQSNAIVAGPLMAFINSQPDSLSSLIRNGSNVVSGGPSTTTVSPAEASGILSSLSAMGSTPTSSAGASTTSDTSVASATSSMPNASASGTSSTPDPSATASQTNSGVVFSMVPMPTSA